jgi:hypothetical protein
MTNLPPGTRVRVNDRSGWPERIGSDGVIMAPAPDGSYPQPGPGEVLLLLDNDPLDPGRRNRTWSCVINARALDTIYKEK